MKRCLPTFFFGGRKQFHFPKNCEFYFQFLNHWTMGTKYKSWVVFKCDISSSEVYGTELCSTKCVCVCLFVWGVCICVCMCGVWGVCVWCVCGVCVCVWCMCVWCVYVCGVCVRCLYLCVYVWCVWCMCVCGVYMCVCVWYVRCVCVCVCVCGVYVCVVCMCVCVCVCVYKCHMSSSVKKISSHRCHFVTSYITYIHTRVTVTKCAHFPRHITISPYNTSSSYSL